MAPVDGQTSSLNKNYRVLRIHPRHTKQTLSKELEHAIGLGPLSHVKVMSLAPDASGKTTQVATIVIQGPSSFTLTKPEGQTFNLKRHGDEENVTIDETFIDMTPLSSISEGSEHELE